MKLLGNMLDLDNKLGSAAACPIVGHTQMRLVSSETQYHVVFPDGAALGEMNLPLEEALNSIMQQQQHLLQYEVFVPVRAVRETISKAAKEKDAIARVQINVYGTPTASKIVGHELSERKIYLQRPEHIRSGVVYDNPHILKLEDFETVEHIPTLEIEEPVVEKATGQIVKDAISNVYSSLTRGHNLTALEGDRRLRTELLQ